MKELRERTKDRFEEMRLRARDTVRGVAPGSRVGPMGPIKSFGGLQDSILKMRENFEYLVFGGLHESTERALFRDSCS